MAATWAQMGAALAAGPIFVVVSGRSGGSRASLAVSIRRQIGADRRAVARAGRRQTMLTARLHRLQAKLDHAVDPFRYEDAVAAVDNEIVSTGSRVIVLHRLIRRLRVALQPVRLPSAPTGASSDRVGWDAVAVAEHYLGVRYRWGGSNPSSGFDCSGFVKFVYAHLGLALPHYAASQFNTTPHVDPQQLRAGDLVFFEPGADGPGHVGIYIGDGVLIEAPHTGDVVKLAPVATLSDALGFVGATRPAQLVG